MNEKKEIKYYVCLCGNSEKDGYILDHNENCEECADAKSWKDANADWIYDAYGERI